MAGARDSVVVIHRPLREAMLGNESAAGAELLQARRGRVRREPRLGPRGERRQRLIRRYLEHAGLPPNGPRERLGARRRATNGRALRRGRTG